MQTVQSNFKQVLVILAIASLTLVSSAIFTTPAMAANGINRTINFQGRLVRNDAGNVGLNVANNTYSVVFTFYNNGTAGQGTALWTETQTVTTTDGIFRVALGSVTPIPANVNFNWDGLYLGIKVGADTEMTPRITMAAVPFAFNAQQVAGLIVQDSTSGAGSTSATLKIGNATTPSTVDLGANNLTFTTSGATTLTLPTLGTLLSNGLNSNQTISSNQASGNVLSIADTSGTGTLAGLSFNLTGSGTTYDLLGSGSTWNVTKAGVLNVASCIGCGVGGSGYATIQLAGSPLTQRTALNFAGTGISCVDNSGSTRTDCTVNSGGGSSSPFTEITGSNGGFVTALNSTEDFLFGGQSTASASFHIFGSTALRGVQPVASISASTSYAALVIDNTIGDFITASSSGITKFVVRQDGSVSLGVGSNVNAGYTLDVLGSARIGSSNTSGDDIYKSTTADFTQAGSAITQASGTGYNINQISTANNQMTLVTDLLGAGATITTAGANGTGTGLTAVGAGAVAFQRPDSKFVVVTGASNVAKIYDPATGNFLNGFNIFSTVGAGSQVFQRQNGSFVIVAGGGTGNTTLYYPGGGAEVGSSKIGPSLVGPRSIVTPNLPPQALVGAGSQVLRKSDGKFLLLLGGGSANTNIYDPTATSSASPSNDLGNFDYGPQLTGAVNTGSFAFETIFGKWIIGLGGNGLNMYDPTTGVFTNIASTTGWGATSTGAGVHVIQRPDYKYEIIIGGGSTSTLVYDPVANIFSAGPSLSVGVNAGSHSFQRSDGKWVTVLGSATSSTTTNIYDPTGNSGAGTYTDPGSGGYLANAVGVGALTFQRPDGKYIVISGGTTANTTYTIYDAGWNTTGTWTSENLTSANISTYSAILWTGDPQSANNNARLDKSTIDVFVKTAPTSGGLAAVPWTAIANSGNLLGGYLNPSQAVQIQVVFNAPVRSYPQLVTSTINQSNIWSGEGATFNRRTFLTPSIYTIRIQNPLVQYGGGALADAQSGRNFATAGALLEGVVTTNTNQLSLAINRNLPTSTPSAGFIIASASANLGVNAGAGAHALVMPNGQFLVIPGNSSAATRIYDPDANSFTAGPSLPGGTVGTGAHSFQLPNGKFFTVMGNTTKLTAIYDPAANNFIAGPPLIVNTGAGANSFQRPDGLFVILSGSSNQTSIYDPFLNQITQGPNTTTAIGAGAFNLTRPDGRTVIFIGAGGATNVYDAATNAFVVGTTLTTNTVNTGSGAVQLSTGRVLIKTAATTTSYYDPILNTNAIGPTTTTAAAGSFIIPRPDGKVLFGNGASTTTNIFDPQLPATALAVGPVLPCTINTGGFVFQRSDGTYVLICGGGGQNTAVIDPGWNLGGTYYSEQIYEPVLNSNTALFWQNVGQGNIYVKYRTAASQVALGIAGWRDIKLSGNKINITAGGQWIQVRFDLQGSLSGMPGSEKNVWLGADDGGMVSYYRTVATPVLASWKLMDTSTPNILTLTNNGSNAFRFTADGQAYTAAGGAWNAGGADLAENYTSAQTLNPGEVVVGDKLNSLNVQRSNSPYQANIMGVVSTKPGFVAGAYTPDSYPIALVGRVPVKISTENGPIKSGDYLTSASIPGYAMKATVAGRVLGTALQDFDPNDPSQFADCPSDGAGSLSTTQCGTIAAFINLTNYNGQNVELAMADDNFTASPSGLSQPEINTGLTSYVKQISAGDQNILAYLESLHSAAFNSSEVFAGKVAAGEIISPNIVADLITAKTIRADHIEGLEILTNQLSALTNSMAVLSDATQSGEFATSSAYMPTSLNLSSLNVNGFATISADLNVKGSGFFQGALNVLSDLTTKNLLVSQFAYFINDVVFKGNVRFNSTPTFNNDTAGFAVIKQGLDTVQVTFNQEYVNTPIVTASIALDKTGDNVSQKSLEDQILNGNVSYVITQRTTKGFVIKLSKPAVENINFSWVSLSVQDAKTSGLNLNATPIPAATNSAAFQSVLDQLNPSPTPAQ